MYDITYRKVDTRDIMIFLGHLDATPDGHPVTGVHVQVAPVDADVHGCVGRVLGAWTRVLYRAGVRHTQHEPHQEQVQRQHPETDTTHPVSSVSYC